MLKLVDTPAPAWSIAVTRTPVFPTFAFAGVPLKVRVAALKLSQDGRAEPSERAALQVSASPTSTSEKLSPGTMKLQAASSVAFWLVIALATMGASLVFATETEKPSDLETPARFVALICSAKLPTLTFSGVPLNVRVTASKPSQDGSAAPSALLAL